jgi:hypothetical protein
MGMNDDGILFWIENALDKSWSTSVLEFFEAENLLEKSQFADLT